MVAQERGTCTGSDLYFQTPSEGAQRMLFYMTSCGYYLTNHEYRIQRDNYHNFLIFYVCRGRLSVQNEGITQVAADGQIGFINCHVPHEYHTIGSTEFVWVHLEGVNSAQMYAQIVEQHGGFIFNTPRAEEVKNQIYEIVSACRTEQLQNEANLSHQLYGILIALLDDRHVQAGEAPIDSPILQAAQFIREHYSDPISLPDVARIANMSQYHFSRQFKKECGYSPHEYVILTRINRAKHLLKTTDMPIKIIAQTVGYQNLETFTSAFSRRVGMAPSLFRKYPI